MLCSDILIPMTFNCLTTGIFADNGALINLLQHCWSPMLCAKSYVIWFHRRLIVWTLLEIPGGFADNRALINFLQGHWSLSALDNVTSYDRDTKTMNIDGNSGFYLVVTDNRALINFLQGCWSQSALDNVTSYDRGTKTMNIDGNSRFYLVVTDNRALINFLQGRWSLSALDNVMNMVIKRCAVVTFSDSNEHW